MAFKGEVEGDILELVLDAFIAGEVLVSAEVVMTARMPYSFKIAGSLAP